MLAMSVQAPLTFLFNRSMHLDQPTFVQAVHELTCKDGDLAQVIESYGRPPLWVREPGFPTLVYIILEQQVSLASAKAAFDRLNVAARPLTPGRFLKLSDGVLKRIGFSRQKTHYARLLAMEIQKRRLDLRAMHALPDDAPRERLLALKGVGPGTADLYL